MFPNALKLTLCFQMPVMFPIFFSFGGNIRGTLVYILYRKNTMFPENTNVSTKTKKIWKHS